MSYKMSCSALRKNGYILLEDRPCKIVAISDTAADPVHITGVDIFTGGKIDGKFEPNGEVDIPNIARNEYQLVNIDSGYLNLMSMDGVPKDDVLQPDGVLGENLKDSFEAGKDLYVTVTSAMNEEQAISFKEAATKV